MNKIPGNSIFQIGLCLTSREGSHFASKKRLPFFFGAQKSRVSFRLRPNLTSNGSVDMDLDSAQLVVFFMNGAPWDPGEHLLLR